MSALPPIGSFQLAVSFVTLTKFGYLTTSDQQHWSAFLILRLKPSSRFNSFCPPLESNSCDVDAVCLQAGLGLGFTLKSRGAAEL